MELVFTEDGSLTLFNNLKNEHYHSIHGAIQESLHVFIKNGFRFLFETLSNKSSTINILEIGFGTGLNALLTLNEISDIKYTHLTSIDYIGIEPYPISLDIVNKLNYCKCLNSDYLKEDYLLMHQSESRIQAKADNRFNFSRINVLFQDFIIIDKKIDLVYFDAFSPETEPDLWTDDIFKKLHHIMNEGGVLVTYCSKGDVRRSLQNNGFKVDRLPGPPGKHHMIRAIASAIG